MDQNPYTSPEADESLQGTIWDSILGTLKAGFFGCLLIIWVIILIAMLGAGLMSVRL